MTRTPVEVVVRAPADRCFAEFCDAPKLPMWVPGLRRAKVVRARPDGLPLEVLYEYGKTLTYSVLYEYDLPALRVTWSPGVGRRDSVGGWAEFVPEGPDCRMRYAVDARFEGEAERLVEAFGRWMARATR